MGASIEILHKENSCGEEGADIMVSSSSLKNTLIQDSDIIPKIIDEIPILAIAGIFSEGVFSISNAEELRYKESDRIKSICENLKRMNIEVEEKPDGFSFQGVGDQIDKIKPALIESYSDHRILMSFEIANQILKQKKNASEDILTLQNKEWIDTSFPNFYRILKNIL